MKLNWGLWNHFLMHPNLEIETFSQKERNVHCVQNAESGCELQRIMGMME